MILARRITGAQAGELLLQRLAVDPIDAFNVPEAMGMMVRAELDVVIEMRDMMFQGKIHHFLAAAREIDHAVAASRDEEGWDLQGEILF